MYIVYKWKPNDTASAVGVCFTRNGANRAIRHFRHEYSIRHPEREYELGYERVMLYAAIKATTFMFKV